MSELPPNVPRPKRKGERNHKRTTKERGYGILHQRLRSQVLAEEPLCQYQFPGCSGWSTQMDHADRNVRNTARENLIACCEPCHIKKTLQERK